MRIVERDYEILREVYRWRFCLGRHIKELVSFSGARACDKRLRTLIDAGYINRKKILYGVPSVYFLTNTGKTLMGVKPREDKFRIERIPHDIAVIDTAIYISKKYDVKTSDIATEKEMYSKEGFGTRKHFPDFKYEKDGQKVCVEIELTQKAKHRFEKNIKDNYFEYDKQIWIVSNAEPKIHDLLNEFAITYTNIEIIKLEEVQKGSGDNQ